MKKVSVQFNIEVDDAITHKDVKNHVIENVANYNSMFRGVTSVQVNNIEKKTKK